MRIGIFFTLNIRKIKMLNFVNSKYPMVGVMC